MGKVHGGLTRAGKVRNQTKKPEKVDTGKKKFPSGRAYLRYLYSKRMVMLNGDNKKYKFNPQRIN
ncbi:ribosomal protein s30, putative [Entamoeba histolytica HM-1:IMSS-B]|uniref:40S ribosomal protein S30 n=8 Tax=Entamoeba TaxID=5758 RepID=C4LT77_ENTH1|nr:ribosomal protein s30, putative [Entamoeba nuttalli P19]XP_008860465.1 ribosomal protein s30, putative [Entamoeba nuttalli P19]XP_656699.1 Ribosomal protein S30, putative [Entamoeba histolytica HM-1:IMSS]XP_657241.1 Ribosomal protein S30, putative [Entamoeba histolytica HM-1:IMSS]EMD45043.1 ribosomal protein S30 [Entamoeba histolytica KU27]EMH72319.1 ribosomal protein s30, putative [Entamoeba histolytica HM-1:IMSS-B]EMS10745.1 ribosomal protein s30, putative [Entamoeba histolytica HM-3:IMS|eukprot:XP_008855375.1 ribosomal protein s30, putative [Entamoeba nuttalli P19]